MLLIAGSRGMSGAAMLSALGALRGGAGLLTVAIGASERPVITRRLPEAMTLPLPETSNGLLSPKAWGVIARADRSRDFDVFAVGPGLGQSLSVRVLVRQVLKKANRPVVLDADGLNNLQARSLPKHGPLVVTPHAKEFERFFGRPSAPRELAVSAVARAQHLVCVLKGAGSLISDGQQLYQNTTGNPAMATGGMGDVLTGLIAALLAQGLAPLEAAAAGVYLHGLAADLMAKSDRGLLASDVAGALPLAFRRIGLKP